MLELRMLKEIMSRAAKRRFVILLVASLASALTTLIGVSSVIPFMAVVADPDLVHQNQVMHSFYELVGSPDNTTFLIILGVAMLCALALGNGMSALSTLAGLQFTMHVSHELSTRLLRAYMARPYVWFLNKSSSNLGKNVLSEVNQAVSGFVQPLSNFIVRSVTSVLLLAMIVAIDPLIAVFTALLLGGAYFSVYFLLRQKIRRYGRARLRRERIRFKVASECLQGVRDVKLLHCQESFADLYSRASREMFQLRARAGAISSLPQHLMETTAFGGIIAVIIYLLVSEGDLKTALPLLSLYAVCGIKLMPAIQQTYQTITNMRFNAPALHRLHRDLTELPEPEVVDYDGIPPWQFEQEIVFQDVGYAYPQSDMPVLRGICVTIPKNTSAAFVGGTGAGKTTLINLLLGLLSPTAGAVVVDGQPLNDENILSWQRTVGYVPQDIFLLDDTVARNIAFGLSKSQVDQERVKEAARIANIHEFIISELPKGYDTVIGERGMRLSGGQRQRLGIARALYRNPSVLILDEATSALDGTTETAVVEAITRLSGTKTLIMIAHRLTTIKDCDRIYLLENGRIADTGTFEELLEGNATFRGFAKITT